MSSSSTTQYLTPANYELALLNGGFDMDRDGQIDPAAPVHTVTQSTDLTGLVLYAHSTAAEPEYQDDNSPTLAIDGEGVPHIVWSRGHRVWHAYFNGAEWVDAQPISNGPGSNLSLQVAGNLIDGSQAGLIAAWEEGLDNEAEIFYAVGRPKAGGGGYEWSDPIQLTNDALRDAIPTVIITDSGNALITYVKRDASNQDDTDVYYALVDIRSGELIWSASGNLLSQSSDSISYTLSASRKSGARTRRSAQPSWRV